ncbi:MAG: hypothetical protein LBS93_05400 [Synergistaceae bacterium]|nr:hypothetical protein [Synergistaceae bacterium]
MLRPIDSSISILNTDQRAPQIKDPNAHQFQAVQQVEVAKRIQHEAQSVQPGDRSDEDTRIKDRDSGRNKKDGHNKKKRGQPRGAGEEGKTAASDEAPTAERGGFNFLA